VVVAAQRQFLIKVQGVDGLFATKTGGQVTSAVTKAWNGGSLRPERLTSPPEADDLTVGRPYDPVRDSTIARQLRPLIGAWTTTVTVQPTDQNLAPTGQPTVYSDALLSSVHEPDADAASGTEARFELVFSVVTPA
jgi:hypothetical protein